MLSINKIDIIKSNNLPAQSQDTICPSAETVAPELLHGVLGDLHLLPRLVHHHLLVPLTGGLGALHLLKSAQTVLSAAVHWEYLVFRGWWAHSN